MIILLLNVTTCMITVIHCKRPQQNQKINTSNAELKIQSISGPRVGSQQCLEWSETVTLHCFVCAVIILHVYI